MSKTFSGREVVKALRRIGFIVDHSRIENHAEDIKLSTLERVASALGKRLEVKIA